MVEIWKKQQKIADVIMELMVLRNDTGEYDVYVPFNFPEEKLKPHMQSIKDICFLEHIILHDDCLR